MHTESSLSLHRKPRIVLLEKIFFATLNIFATPPLHNQNLNIKLFVIHDEEMRYSEWSPPSPPLSPSTMPMCDCVQVLLRMMIFRHQVPVMTFLACLAPGHHWDADYDGDLTSLTLVQRWRVEFFNFVIDVHQYYIHNIQHLLLPSP